MGATMAKCSSGEMGDQTLLERPRSDPASDCDPAPNERRRLRSPVPQEPPHADRPGSQPPSEADDEHKPQDRSEGEEARKSWFRRHPTAVAFGLLCLVLAMAAGYLYWDYSRHFETTDDAYIAARQFAIAPEVWGYITAVPVTDNQHVDAGGVIARLDDRNYRIALAQAEAQVASAQGNIEIIDAQMKVQQAQIAANQALLEQAQDELAFAQVQAARYQYLARTQIAGTVQNAQLYPTRLVEQQAAVKTAQANLTLSQRQVEALKAQRDSAVANLAQAKAQRDQAQVNLSYTTITAAQAGHVVQLSAAVGQFAQPGANLAMFVPEHIWVTANFKETQLDSMRPGEPVTITIDAYPEHTIHGHLASVQPGSGTAFSLLPAENATGNWVKIVQRVPVKIVMDNPPTDVALGPGMSVEASVRVNPNPSLYERLRRWL
jgi:membrane fusion protein (multidrug efflux system)